MTTTDRHALEPLSADEIATAAAIVRADAGLDPSAWFETVTLDEPDRASMATGRSKRRAYVACYEPATNRTFDGLVDLEGRKIARWTHRPGAQARIVTDEFMAGGKAALADPAFQAALRQRGITDFDKVLVEPWAAGNFGIAEEAGERLAYAHCWLANDAGDNPYGRPIANLHPVIDLQRMRVVRIDDFGALPLPPDPGPVRRSPARADLKPLAIEQRDGPSFRVDGHAVAWQNWEFRVGAAPRDGLILHDIGYRDQGRLRPIMHRASLSEMVVPYGDPGPGNARRNAFDTGEYGLGQFLDSLEFGCDCLGAIHYFDVVSHDWHGQPKTLANAICMHEEDYGILWKLPPWITKSSVIARSRRLVVSTVATIGNYVYGFFWYFYQDGTIGIEVKATGIPFPTGTTVGAASEWGAIAAPGIELHAHQHSFSFRFDMCVDGPSNAVRETEFEPVPIGPANPWGNGVRTVSRPLKSELAARRRIDFDRARSWTIINTERENRLGLPVGYRLVPGTNTLPFLAPTAPVAKRAGFMFQHFWATPYAADELYAAGWYPNQHAGGDGLPRWSEADRNLEGERVVAWYTLNYHHHPRPEDWPVQPTVYANFHWTPAGFFDANPALDVPQPEAGKHDCG